MQEVKGLVSIVVPAYNAASFLKETIESIKQQTVQEWELIVVNDGSSDNTSAIVREAADDRIILIEQTNVGVSAARNRGLMQAKGEYIVFLDADDLLAPDFLQVRKAALDNNDQFGFAGGWVETFPINSPLRRGAGTDPVKEILYFDPAVTAVPSNYMIRRKLLIKHNILFNSSLYSSADRFFLIELTRYTQGVIVPPLGGRLLYRISENSMSHKVDTKLIFDKLKFYYELERTNLLPANRKADIKSRMFFSVALSFAKLKDYRRSFNYLLGSFRAQPYSFSRFCYRKMRGKPW